MSRVVQSAGAELHSASHVSKTKEARYNLAPALDIRSFSIFQH